MMNLVERLISSCRIDDPDDCWVWTKCCSESGHGRISVGPFKARRMERAHRVSYRLFVGDIPEGEVVRHRCDNPPCCNPRHLVLGSQRENVDDMVKRHRHRSGFAKLEPDQVVDIRERAALGEPPPQIADAMGIALISAQRIIRRETWATAEDMTWLFPCPVSLEEVPF
jgi:hypothetical protein